MPLWKDLIKQIAKKLLNKYGESNIKLDLFHKLINPFVNSTDTDPFFNGKAINLIASFLYMYYLKAEGIEQNNDIEWNKEACVRYANEFKLYFNILDSKKYKEKISDASSENLISSILELARSIFTTNFDDIIPSYFGKNSSIKSRKRIHINLDYFDVSTLVNNSWNGNTFANNF